MKYKIILASNSPRRRELLAGLDVNFEVKVLRGIDESYPEDLDAYDVAEYIAQKKADAYRSLLDGDEASEESFNKDNRNKVFSRIAEFKRLLLGHNVTQVEYAMMLNLIDNHFTAK